jgi:hypothetical protein
MTLMHRVAGALRFGHRTAGSDEEPQLTVHQQLDRLADSRSVVESDLAREQRLADRLEAEARKALAAGADAKARRLADQRETLLIRINELRAAHRVLTEAITERARAAGRDQEGPIAESDLLTSAGIPTAFDPTAADR